MSTQRAPSPTHPDASQTRRPRNRLLASLPDDDLVRIRPLLRTVPVVWRQHLHEDREPIRDVFFLNGGVASVTATMANGGTVEVATIGIEGVVGIGAFFGDHPAAGETMLQVPEADAALMTAESMTAEAFRTELRAGGALYDRVSRYSHGLMRLMMQSTACMALHSVQERCCRWLLMTHDRVEGDVFQLSHEYLAMMLGSTRPTVTVVAGTLQHAGLIRYKQGRVHIIDRAELEHASCECYAVAREQFDRLGL
jgi:CRP-like cAMP-binding protein